MVYEANIVFTALTDDVFFSDKLNIQHSGKKNIQRDDRPF